MQPGFGGSDRYAECVGRLCEPEAEPMVEHQQGTVLSRKAEESPIDLVHRADAVFWRAHGRVYLLHLLLEHSTPAAHGPVAVANQDPPEPAFKGLRLP